MLMDKVVNRFLMSETSKEKQTVKVLLKNYVELRNVEIDIDSGSIITAGYINTEYIDIGNHTFNFTCWTDRNDLQDGGITLLISADVKSENTTHTIYYEEKVEIETNNNFFILKDNLSLSLFLIIIIATVLIISFFFILKRRGK